MREIPFSPPDITEKEIELVAEALKSGWITTGPKTKEFERRISSFCGTEKAVCLNSATAALELTLRLLGIGPGDEVIVPAYTYTASASVIDHVGATIVMVDSVGKGMSPYEMDYEKLEEVITDKTKVIIPVDLGGRLCNYGRIFEIVKKKKSLFKPNSEIQRTIGRIAVVADSAHGFGAESFGEKSGTFADFTCFSFHAVKNLTTAEGGAVTWKTMDGVDNEKIYKEYMLASLHGQSKDALAKNQIGAWEYDIVYPAYKCNMTDIQAAIGLAQLERYEGMLQRRKEIIEKYDEVFLKSGLEVLNHFDEVNKSSGHLYIVRVPKASVADRNLIIDKMGEKGVACSVHYKPLPMHTAYKNLGFDIGDYPVAFGLYGKGITLPLYSKLSDEEVEYVIESLLASIKEVLNER